MAQYWKAVGDSVLIKVGEVPEASAAGIIIPAKVKRKVFVGVVIAVGPEVQGLKVGDEAYFDRNLAVEVPVDEDLWSVHSTGVIAATREEV